MCDQHFSKRTAFSYLEDLATQFYSEYGTKIQSVARPYSFIEFGLLCYYIIYIYILVLHILILFDLKLKTHKFKRPRSNTWTREDRI